MLNISSICVQSLKAAFFRSTAPKISVDRKAGPSAVVLTFFNVFGCGVGFLVHVRFVFGLFGLVPSRGLSLIVASIAVHIRGHVVHGQAFSF